LLASFTFTSKNAHKSFSTVTYLYDQVAEIKITPGFALSIVPSDLQAASNWSSGSLGSTNCSDNLKAIQFDNTQLTIAQAIQAVKNYYVAQTPDNLPCNGASFLEGVTGHNYSTTVFRMP
jgi:hypothetical protein